MKKKLNKVLLYIIMLMFMSVICLSNNALATKGEDIARKSYSRKESQDESSLGKMILIDKSNRKKVRQFEMFSKEGDDGRTLLIVFLEPADIKDTKFLNIGHRKGDDEQRLYLPALGKIRRITSANKNGSFVESDMNYYDLEDREYDDYSSFKYLKDATSNGKECYVVEQIPNDKYAPYSKQIMYVGKDDYFQYKLENYDKRNPDRLVKTIVVVDVDVTDDIVTFTKMVAVNHYTNHKTLFEIKDLKINPGLDDKIFSIQNLKK